MTITEYASELTDQMRAQDVDGPALRQALAVAVAMWMDIDRPGPVELRWGLFASQVAAVADSLYPERSDVAVTVESDVLGDEQVCRAVARQLVTVAADTLEAAGREPGKPRGWQYAHAAIALRTALGHLP